MIKLKVNGQPHQLAVPADVPLLWVLREELRLTGTKFGCGIAACGACTVHLDGEAVRSCSYPVGAAAGHSVTTIEALAATPQAALQQAWIAEQVPQCGYCQSGMLMSAAALLRAHPRPTDAQIDTAMTNICRCGTYGRVRAAIHRAAAQMAAGPPG
ncbi:(2Fe-2S)-binding protein [Roseateles saccharophilus]|uniref:Isoquinoline 1-oxidoreductase alpha subunit n=1 Tax=Roseateles saccharophilus TaxID=304 RepID=A0A4R3V1T7_ROSSA|nr:(2Fe-2S)-binding protein [Roseateles saccharophilus]TCU97472.1 isoquinoline 1-oxidoreductase alpha subunit [Roseateles saccharophilus]